MVEGSLPRGILSDGMPVAKQLVLVGHQALEPHWTPRVQLAGADPQLSAQSVTETIREARRSIVVDTRGVDFLEEPCCRFLVFGDDRLGMPRTEFVNVTNGFVEARNNLDRENAVRVLRRPVLFRRG